MVEADRGVKVPANFGCAALLHGRASEVALIDGSVADASVKMSYQDLDDRCDSIALALVGENLMPGDRVGLLAANSCWYVAALLGIMRAGCVAVPLNRKLVDRTLAFIARDADLKLIVVDRVNAPRVPSGYPTTSLEEFGSGMSRPWAFEAYDPDPRFPCLQLYTSGSTGRPKGVVLTHSGQQWAISGFTSKGEQGELRSLIAAPLYHKNGLFACKLTLWDGGTSVLLPRFEAAEYLRLIERHRCTSLTGVPTMFARLLEETALLKQLDVSSVTAVRIGSAPLSLPLVNRVKAAFPTATVVNGYGTTEAVGVFGDQPRGPSRPGNSIGVPRSGVEVRVAHGPDATEGVLHVRAPSIMLGYHNLPDLTTEKLRDGWYDTGDVVRKDADGWFYFVGRADDMFVCSGENVYPGEVESLLERHPLVAQAIVVPLADGHKGAVPVAFIVPIVAGSVTEREIWDFALANGPGYAHPRSVTFVDALPWSGTNKIDRQSLIERARAEHGGMRDG